jgi:tellurite resistance protein TerA
MENTNQTGGIQMNAKVVLKEKGDAAVLPSSFREMLVTMKWTKAVDLDLMAFYKKKDGTVGSVFTNLLGGSLGDLNSFPFIKSSGDAGVGARAGQNQEVITFSKVDPTIAEIYIVALNFTAAKDNRSEAFKSYDGALEVKTDSSTDSFGMLLDSPETGVAALIAKIDNTGIAGPKLIKENRILSLQQLVSEIPGATALQR